MKRCASHRQEGSLRNRREHAGDVDLKGNRYNPMTRLSDGASGRSSMVFPNSLAEASDQFRGDVENAPTPWESSPTAK